jgi:hypothetical protein
LNPQIPKTTEPNELATLKQPVRRVLQRHYSEAFEMAPSENSLVVAEQSLFSCFFGDEGIGCFARNTRGDGVGLFLSIGVVNSTKFIDVIQWWDARKTVLPAGEGNAAHPTLDAQLTTNSANGAVTGRREILMQFTF